VSEHQNRIYVAPLRCCSGEEVWAETEEFRDGLDCCESVKQQRPLSTVAESLVDVWKCGGCGFERDE
jgi:hypothetical protein